MTKSMLSVSIIAFVILLLVTFGSGCDSTRTQADVSFENPYEAVAQQHQDALSFTTEYVNKKLASASQLKAEVNQAQLTKEAFFTWAKEQGWDEQALARAWDAIEQEQQSAEDLPPREAVEATLDDSELNEAQKEYILRLGDAAQASSTIEEVEAAVQKIEGQAYLNLPEGEYDIVLAAAASVKGMARHWVKSGQSLQPAQHGSTTQVVARVDATRTSDPYCQHLPDRARFYYGEAVWRSIQGAGIGCGIGGAIGAGYTWWTGPGVAGGATAGCIAGAATGAITGAATYGATYYQAHAQWCYECRGRSELANRECETRARQN